MSLHNLKPAVGSTFTKKRLGRGEGSGSAGTSGRGHKGAKSRSGYSKKIGFEGGQMPLQRRVPKFGFTNPNRTEYRVINLDIIQKLIDDHPMTNQDGKVRFLNFGASSLDIMILYYVNSPDWEVLIDAQQKINFDIIDIVNKYKCDFAFPSTSVYIEKN